MNMAFSMNPVVGKEFVGRGEILKTMLQELGKKNTRNGFALYGKRRVGKTSALLEVKRRLAKNKHIVPIYISIWDLVEWKVEEFCQAIVRETVDAYREKIGLRLKFEELAKSSLSGIPEILKSMRLEAKVTELVTFAVSFKKEEKQNLNQILNEALLFPEKLAEETGTKAVLMIDEFPSIVELTNGKKIGKEIIGKIRTVNEKYKRTALCVSGSIMKTMENAVFSSSSAFYGQLIPIHVKPLSEAEAKQLLKNNLKGISDDAIKTILQLTSGFPLYIHAVGLKLAAENKKGEKEARNAFENFLYEEGTLIFKRDLYACSSKERLIVIKMAHGLSSVTTIAKAMKDNPSIIGRLLSYLEEKGVVEKEGAKYTLSDPVFEMWIKKTYPS